MKMAGQYIFPDPDDRSKNDPCIISNKKVLGMYDQAHPGEEKMQKVTDKVQNRIKAAAAKKGWDDVKIAGGQCLLENKFQK